MNTLSLRHERGYTLTEIVLVVGILLALAALVFGLLGPIREKTREMTCVSNLHQYRTAFALYRQDYGGIEPVEGMRLSAAQMGLPPPSATAHRSSAERADTVPEHDRIRVEQRQVQTVASVPA